eukprot:g22639.t1
MDDLHRIEAILATVKPSSSSYQAARTAGRRLAQRTATSLLLAKADPCGWRSLERNECFYHKSLGVRKLSCAVRLVRHSVALRRRERNGLDLGEKKEPHREKAQQIEKWAASELAAAGVVIPEDLSFAGDDLNGSSQEGARSGTPTVEAVQKTDGFAFEGDVTMTINLSFARASRKTTEVASASKPVLFGRGIR